LPLNPENRDRIFFKLTREQSMKKISQLLLITLAVTALAACGDMGKGPEKPASAKALLEK
jgi:hypothetical protein